MTILRGATVLITGGASGIGLMLGEYLLKSGITQLIIGDIHLISVYHVPLRTKVLHPILHVSQFRQQSAEFITLES